MTCLLLPHPAILTDMLACRSDTSSPGSDFDRYTETPYKIAPVGPVEEPVDVHFALVPFSRLDSVLVKCVSTSVYALKTLIDFLRSRLTA
jgi:hypothetical protein